MLLQPGDRWNTQTVFLGIRIHIIKICRPWDRLIFMIGIPTLVGWHNFIAVPTNDELDKQRVHIYIWIKSFVIPSRKFTQTRITWDATIAILAYDYYSISVPLPFFSFLNVLKKLQTISKLSNRRLSNPNHDIKIPIGYLDGIPMCPYYRKTSNISRTLVGNKIVDHSDVVGASPVGAAPTTSSFST